MLAAAITTSRHLSMLETSERLSRAHTDFLVPVLVQPISALTLWSIGGLHAACRLTLYPRPVPVKARLLSS